MGRNHGFTAIATSPRQLIALRLLLGVSEALLTPASMRWIRMNCREEQRGLAIGVVMAGTKVGPAIGAPLAAFLITQAGWQMMFVLLGSCSLLWLAPWVRFATDGESAAVSPGANQEHRLSPISPATRSYGEH